ncbi:MAG: efflux RND transporter periplasmic adaptor subunit [Mucilaginibacter sp.]
MDRKIEKKKWNSKRIMIITAAIVFVAGITWLIVSASGKSKLDVDPDRITISEVTKGQFQEIIPVNGVVAPITTIYLDAVEGGRVEKLYVEDGAQMKAGQPIMKLSDLDLELQLAQQQAQVFNTITQMQINRGQATTATVNKQQAVADADNAYNDALRVYNLDKKLYAEKAIGLQEWQIAQNTYQYALRKKKLNEQIMKQDSSLTKQQDKQSQEEFDNMKKNLDLMKQKVGDLVVKSPIDGQLSSMDAEVGQNITKGERLGEIDVLTGFKVKVTIDEHYIARVYKGLTGTFDFADKTYNLKIKKVYEQVKAGTGQFQVDMEFVGDVPKDIRVGQTLQIRLALSDPTQAILLPKGGFFQTTGGNWIFKLNPDGKTAYRQDIQLNRSSPDYYEVIGGLKPGDKVIISSYDTYGDNQELVLK